MIMIRSTLVEFSGSLFNISSLTGCDAWSRGLWSTRPHVPECRIFVDTKCSSIAALFPEVLKIHVVLGKVSTPCISPNAQSVCKYEECKLSKSFLISLKRGTKKGDVSAGLLEVLCSTSQFIIWSSISTSLRSFKSCQGIPNCVFLECLSSRQTTIAWLCFTAKRRDVLLFWKDLYFTLFIWTLALCFWRRVKIRLCLCSWRCGRTQNKFLQFAILQHLDIDKDIHKDGLTISWVKRGKSEHG